VTNDAALLQDRLHLLQVIITRYRIGGLDALTRLSWAEKFIEAVAAYMAQPAISSIAVI
jgi:hypothetical protein